MSRKLIITADDYGYADHIDRGIIKAAKSNCLTSVSCFSNIPRTKLEAKIAELKAAKLDIGIGMHLTISSGRPILSGLKSLITIQKRFPKYHFQKPSQYKFRKVNLGELERELRAQIEQLASIIGLEKIDHLANHHNFLYFYPPFFEIFTDLAKEYDIPIRSPLNWSKSGKKYYYYKDGNPITKHAIGTAALKAAPWKSLLIALRGVGKHSIEKCIKKCKEKGIRHPYTFMDQIYGQPFLGDWREYWAAINEDEVVEQLHHLSDEFSDRDYKNPPWGVNNKYFNGRSDELGTLTSFDCGIYLAAEQEADNPVVLGTYRDFLDGKAMNYPNNLGGEGRERRII
ncbi:MAG: hypothetical protein ACI9JY_000707 [Saprospiraceae bacterium]|jgi:hypothetical protein